MPKTGDQISNLDAELDALSSPTTADTYAVTKDYDPDVVAASAAKRALSGGAGGGGAASTVLEDPGNSWAAGVAVTDGYRIAESWHGATRVFEAVGAGTTADDGSVFPADYNPDLFPLAETAESVTWRYLGIVGQVSWEYAPQEQSFGEDIDGAYIAGRVAISDAETMFSLYPALPDGSPDAAHPVFVTNSAGDADWFLDINNGSGFRFNVADDGTAITGSGITEMTTDGFKVSLPTGEMLEVNYDPWRVTILGLPTSDPGAGFEGALWNDGGTLKISAGV